MYGKKATELAKELASSQPGQLCTFNKELFDQMLEECIGHLHQLQPLVRKMQEGENKLKDISREDEMGNSEDDRANSQAEKTLIQGAMKSDQFRALVHHLSLVRNKRCLMAYVYNRAEVVRNPGWMVDGDLPEEIEKRLGDYEKEYFKKSVCTLKSSIDELNLDLCVDMIPPKDPYIKVRVLDDIGKVLLTDQAANLIHHALMFLRRTDAEQYITMGQMEELTTIPSLRARDCSKNEKEALNYLFLLIPLLNVAIPFFRKSFAVVWSADTVAFFAMYAWKLGWLSQKE